MHHKPRTILTESLQECLPTLQSLVDVYTIPYQKWTKQGKGHWLGSQVLRPDIGKIFVAADCKLGEVSDRFSKSFFAHHPEYNGVVGFPKFGTFNLGSQDTFLLRSVFAYLWNRYDTFELDASEIESVVSDFELFVDKPNVRFLFHAQLLNFSMPDDFLEFPEGLRVRRMTEREVSDFYGGPMAAFGVGKPSSFGIHEFCIEGEIEERKVFGELKANDLPSKDHVKDMLEKCVLSLRTFKSGSVGIEHIRFTPLAFCPFPVPTHFFGDMYSPLGSFSLSAEEIQPLAEHAKLVFDMSEPSIEMACSRLADAESRMSPRDRLVDAVIGMEAILLAGLAPADRKGELKFRFSLHYSTLFYAPEDRYRAFRLAKSLYDLRSMVAHGSSLGAHAFPLGDENLKLPAAAQLASETLRHLVRHFLPYGGQAPYKKHEFWERAYFGL